MLHRCFNRPCCKPEHLFAASEAEVEHDERNGSRRHPEIVARGERHWTRTHPERRARGDRNGSAELTAEAVREIRRRCEAGEMQTSLARAFGVSDATVSNVTLRKIWKHVA